MPFFNPTRHELMLLTQSIVTGRTERPTSREAAISAGNSDISTLRIVKEHQRVLRRADARDQGGRLRQQIQ
jgi:hypothetical protein